MRTPVNSLPPLQRDTTLEGYDTYSQSDLNLSPKQTATISLAVYPQKLQYMGLNTFTPQPATADFHQRGYEIYGQHRYITGAESALISQLTFKNYDADVTAQSDDPYQLLIDTTEGGYFNRQARQTDRLEWEETYNFSPRRYLGTHQLKAGLNYAYSSYDGREAFLPVTIVGASGLPIESITFSHPTSFNVDQSETSWFVADQWALSQRVTVDLGVRFDSDTVTGATHAAPRAGFLLALTSDGKTLLKGGVGIFYDRVPLIYPVFDSLPYRTVSLLDSNGLTLSSTSYLNQIVNGLHNPQSTSWSVALERQVVEPFTLRVGYELQRNTTKVFVVSPVAEGRTGIITSNLGRDSYQEIQVAGRYKFPRLLLNGSYVRSRAYGNLNDPSLFFGNYPQAVIQPDARARLPFDATNRMLFWGNIRGPMKLMLAPVYELHTGFPYSVQNQFREYVRPTVSEVFIVRSSGDAARIAAYGGQDPPYAGRLQRIQRLQSLQPARRSERGEQSVRQVIQRRVARLPRQAGVPVLTMKNSFIFGAFLLLISSSAFGASNGEALPSADAVVARMLAHNAQRQTQLAGYRGMRRYVLENDRLNKHAEMLVRVAGDADETKHFEVVSQTGWKSAQKHVLQKMLATEADASSPEARLKARLSQDNYEFHMVRAALLGDRMDYVICRSQTQRRAPFSRVRSGLIPRTTHWPESRASPRRILPSGSAVCTLFIPTERTVHSGSRPPPRVSPKCAFSELRASPSAISTTHPIHKQRRRRRTRSREEVLHHDNDPIPASFTQTANPSSQSMCHFGRWKRQPACQGIRRIPKASGTAAWQVVAGTCNSRRP